MKNMVVIDVEEHGDVIILYINGEFYLESVEYADNVWNDQTAKRPKVIGINCKNIKYIDSSAIGVLVKFLNNAMKEKIELVFFDLSETVLSVFKTAKLGNFFTTMSKLEFESKYM
ncbi:MAG: STAS domain-containing protein [bacterium]|nr:STAS domain-containing protein [bacterium]